ncbi:hypothetical protein AGLY_017369 [Aphis glycines]|uniref:DUF4371 domain-containing protein n=1 Tax=Aphis glycines TaxID=307491 RepID=A0A6G0SX14_APHGL|nr:hypothetical protein AGLY_017369 [Aphis glycines]
MVKDKQNSGAQNRNIKKRKLINEAANDKTQTKLFFKPITQSSSILNNTNSLCNNIKDNVVIETIINNKIIHTVQEENDNLINSICIDNTSDKINHDVESMSSDNYLNCDGVSNKDNLMDLSAAEQYLEQSCNSESYNNDNTYNFETLSDTAAFMAPSIEDSFKSKLIFLDQHPIQPIIFNYKKVPFDPKKLYNRQMENGEIVERKWISYQFYTNKIFCSTCMKFSKDIINSFVKDVLLGSMYDKEIEKNRMVLHRVVDIIIVLAKQNLAFRGHRYESITNLSNNHDNLNHGNFLALVKLVAKILGEQIQNSIVKEVTYSGQFSLEIDSTQYVSVVDQLAVCLRYVYKGSNKLRKLQKLGNTRWNSKDVALKTIFHSWSEDNNKRDRFFYLLISLHILGYDEKYIKDTKMTSEARALLMKWSSFENILGAFIYLKLFFLTTPVSKYLETEGLDYIMAWNKIVNLMEEMKKFVFSFEEIKEKATVFSHNMSNRVEDIENIFIEDKLPTRRIKKIKKQSGELSNDSMSVFD